MQDHRSKAQLLSDIKRLERKVEELRGWKLKYEQAKQEKERKLGLALLAENANDALYQLRYHSMTYDYLSPGIINLTGYTPEEINAIGFASLVCEIQHPDGRKMLRDSMLAERKGGQLGEFHADYLLKTKQGTRLWVGDHSFPWLDDNGTVLGSVGILTDITARKSLENELRRKATTDYLTGACTRRHFMNLANREVSRSKRTGSPVSLIMLDVDHFKCINDTYGHAEGDRVLRRICTICNEQLRVSDSLGRMGGEEFAIVLVECILEKAQDVAQRLRKKIQNTFSKKNNEKISCTVSFGVAQLYGPTEELNSLITRADKALYKAKKNGRNCVELDC